MLSNIVSVWLEVEASGADDPTTDRGDMVYAQGLWSAGNSSSIGFEEGSWDDAGMLVGQSLSASEEAAGETARRQAVSLAHQLTFFIWMVLIHLLICVDDWFCKFVRLASSLLISAVSHTNNSSSQSVSDCLLDILGTPINAGL